MFWEIHLGVHLFAKAGTTHYEAEKQMLNQNKTKNQEDWQKQ